VDFFNYNYFRKLRHPVMAAVNLVDGLYPVMLTPFTEDGTAVDYDVLRSLTNWYIDSGSAGDLVTLQFFVRPLPNPQ
jgi:hypothetical protein